MQAGKAGKAGGGDKGSGQRSPSRDEMQVDVCDMSSDDFKNTWLTLKELHDRELQHLHGKLNTLRKRLSDGKRRGSTAKIKELKGRQKALYATIRDLQDQLNAKTCDRCSVNETYRNTLQQEFYVIQQHNLKFIAELTAERNTLREENKELLAKLKMRQQQFRPSSDSDDDDVPGTEKSMPVVTVKEPAPGSQVPLPIEVVEQSKPEQMTSGGKKEQQRSSKAPIPFDSQDPFEVAEAPPEKTSSKSTKPTRGRRAKRKSPAGSPLTSTLGTQRDNGLDDDFSLPKTKRARRQKTSTGTKRTNKKTAKKTTSKKTTTTQKASKKKTSKKKTSTRKTSTPKHAALMDLSWSPSSFSAGENPPIQVVSETSEENMPGCSKNIFNPFIQRKDTAPKTPFNPTLSSNKKLVTGVAECNVGFSQKQSCSQKPINEQLTVRKDTTESTGAAVHGADEPEGETKTFILESAIKRKTQGTVRKKEVAFLPPLS